MSPDSSGNPGAIPRAVIFSLAGPVLQENERCLFREADPLGFILFRRNCLDPAQLRALICELRETLGRDCPVLIDQEGGRVQRLGPPHWENYPAAGTFDAAGGGGLELLKQTARDIAADLSACGIDVNCAPVADVRYEHTHDAIGDRAYSGAPERVAAFAREVCLAFLEQGVTPVIKHLPGQGRATQDSHEALPVIDAVRRELEDSDFLPFKMLAGSPFADRLWGMSAHVIYRDIDPTAPATLSAAVIGDVIRGEIGFDGLLLSDDLSMEALACAGTVEKRALAALKAGCDVALYCAGRYKEMEKIAGLAPPLRPQTLERYERSRIRRRSAA